MVILQANDKGLPINVDVYCALDDYEQDGLSEEIVNKLLVFSIS